MTGRLERALDGQASDSGLGGEGEDSNLNF